MFYNFYCIINIIFDIDIFIYFTLLFHFNRLKACKYQYITNYEYIVCFNILNYY